MRTSEKAFSEVAFPGLRSLRAPGVLCLRSSLRMRRCSVASSDCVNGLRCAFSSISMRRVSGSFRRMSRFKSIGPYPAG